MGQNNIAHHTSHVHVSPITRPRPSCRTRNKSNRSPERVEIQGCKLSVHSCEHQPSEPASMVCMAQPGWHRHLAVAVGPWEPVYLAGITEVVETPKPQTLKILNPKPKPPKS